VIRLLTALLTSAALATPLPLATDPTPTVPATASTGAPVTDGSTVPCPVVKVAPNPPAPAVPSPLPTHGPGSPVIGGPAMATTGLAVPPGSPPPPNDLSATSWVVADLDTGAVLGACAPHAYGVPASLQKLLLAATVLPKLNPTDVITITPEDLNFEPGSSAVGLILGGQYTVETLWLGLFLNSGNDCANTLARLGGGSRDVAGTLDDMNAEARRLGALETHAATPSGLDGPGQSTSAYDLALIARADFARPDFQKYDSALSAQIPPEPPKDPKGYQIQNDNPLLLQYPGAIGGKTGFTDIARHTYVGAAQRNGRRLVVTLLGAEHLPVRTWQQGAALLDWGFSLPAGDSVGRLVDPGEATAAPPTPTTAPTVAAEVVGPTGAGRNPMAFAVTAGVLVFGGFGLALLVLRRRRSRARS
jgi:serine-type D-Ala-D-Ala carboxypeptidase (penicillin-binding protein 5/6)